ncbi:F-box/FBD/LRR-repeat protein At1g13570-like [Silene latifolia]|uniref:F-box/FBD/LRR-repeat protein At1g13570-like n=1 Tax=Silene latifolia TaxID=37657 RepID=UPI003D7852C1
MLIAVNIQKEQQADEGGYCDCRKSSRIISSILLNHNGPVHDFNLYVPIEADDDHIYLNQWISFLSKNGVQKIEINNKDNGMYIPSSIFRCSELVCLELAHFSLNSFPTFFHGFPKLKHLSLVNIIFTKRNIFRSLIENCGMLATLKLVGCFGIDNNVVIDLPNLQTLVLKGEFESLAFRNVRSVKSITLDLLRMPKNLVFFETTVDAVNLLASSCELQSIEVNGHLCKVGSVKNFSQHVIDFDYNYKLDHLRLVDIKGITGLTAELKLVKYLLAISASLENLFFKLGECSIESELEMSRMLMRFPRASPKASVVCLGKWV